MPESVQLPDRVAQRIKTIALFQVGLIIVVGALTAYLAVQITVLEKRRADADAALAEETTRLAGVREQADALERKTADLAEKKATLEAQVKALADRNLALRADLVVNEATIGILQQRDPGLTARAVAKAELQPRLYIQVATPENEALANRLRPRLLEAGFLVPRVERLPATPRSPQVRYFRDEDERYARQVLSLIGERLPGLQVASFVSAPASARMRPHHLELWF